MLTRRVTLACILTAGCITAAASPRGMVDTLMVESAELPTAD